MRVEVVVDAGAVGERSAEIVTRTLAGAQAARLALPTGRTVVPLYASLARRKREGRFELGGVVVYNLDEILLPPEDREASFAAFMREHFVGPLGLSAENWEIPRQDVDPEQECRRYDRVLAEAAPLDLAVLGIGADGHVAYNLPNAVSERTHVVEVPRAVTATLDLPSGSCRAITIGLGPLRSAAQLLLMASGVEKARAIRALVLGRVSAAWPASLLRDHPAFRVIVDRAAASELG